VFDKPQEEIPGSGPDADVLMMDQADEVFQDLRDILMVSIEEHAISNANLHILEKYRWMREASNTCKLG
jgi:hypothetical protein